MNELHGTCGYSFSTPLYTFGSSSPYLSKY